MERDDIFVGLPFSVKSHYDEFRREIPKLEENIEQISRIHDINKRKFDEISNNLSRINESINSLFADMNGNESTADGQ